MSLSALYIIPILGLLIAVHEFGHFWAARRCGVKVEEFGIGIPPRVFGVERGGVLYSFNLIPFGGFVKVKGEDGVNVEPDSMNAQPPIKRIFFLSAGVIMNVLLAIVLMIVVIGAQGVPHNSTYIADVSAGSPAAKAGWQKGDRIVAIDGETVEETADIVAATRDHAGEPVTVTLERRGKEIETTLVPRKNPPEGQGRVGVSLSQNTTSTVTLSDVPADSAAAAAGLQAGDVILTINGRPATDAFVITNELERYMGADIPLTYERGGQAYETTMAVPMTSGTQSITDAVGVAATLEPQFEKVPWQDVVPRGFEEAYQTTVSMVAGIKELFSSRDNVSQLAGPIGMGQLTSELIEKSALPKWVTLTNLTIVLSLNLALLNLLPFPGLDGARLLFVFIEMLRGGKKIPPEKEGLIHMVGIIVLIGLMFWIGFGDIRRIMNGDSFLR